MLTTVEPLPVPPTEPLVTAVLVCRNHVRFVRAAIDSVLGQTHRNIQLLAFDNGSTDGSGDVLKIMAEEHGFVLVLQENIGLARALNRGLNLAQGEYFAVMSTDDIWLPDKIAHQVDYFERHADVHLTFGAIRLIDEDGYELERTKTRGHHIGNVGNAELMAKCVPVNGPTIMVRTETLRRIGGYDESLRLEDLSLIVSLASKNLRVVGLPQLLTLYRRHPASWTATQATWPDVCAVGNRYFGDRDKYRAFVRRRLRMVFRSLAGRRKRDAVRLLLTEPIAWTWDDVGIGIVKLLTPKALLRLHRRLVRDRGAVESRAEEPP